MTHLVLNRPARLGMFGNQLLDRLVQSGSSQLAGRLEARDFAQGALLAEPHALTRTLFFPRSGLISLVVETGDDDQIEAGIIGSRGVLGADAVLGARQNVQTAVVQLPGRLWMLPVEDARELADESEEFRALLSAQQQYLLAQAQQTAACNAVHSISQRLCSWLLRARDECGDGELLMTQQTLAKMLGVQRASVSVFASRLREQGLIEYRRGRLQIPEVEGLRAGACECHRMLREQFERLFAAAKVAQQTPNASGETTAPPQ